MKGIIIGSLRLDRLTVKTDTGAYVAVVLKQSDIPAVKKEFGVEYAKEMIDRRIEIDFATHKIFDVPDEGAPEKKKSSGVLCMQFRIPGSPIS